MLIYIIVTLIFSFILFSLYNAHKLTLIEITKEVTIDGSQGEVFEMVKYLDNYPKWSPFLEADPKQKYELKGTDGKVGAQFHWNGNGGKDLGYQEITKILEPKFVGVKCNIEKPFKAYPTFDYTFASTSQGTLITQNFKLETGLLNGFFMWIFGAKKEMAKTNERGLTLLKNYIEK